MTLATFVAESANERFFIVGLLDYIIILVQKLNQTYIKMYKIIKIPKLWLFFL